MHYATTTAVVLAAICVSEVVAHPAHNHAHIHAKPKAKKDVDWSALDWENMDIDWKDAYAKGQASIASALKVAATTEAAPTSTAAAPSTTLIAVTTSAAAFKIADKVEASSTSSSPAAAATTEASSSLEDAIGSIIDNIADLFDGVVGVSNKLKSFGSQTAAVGTTGALSAGDNYQGNVGSPYGSNVILADSTSGYDFTTTFTNTQSVPITVNIWQKVGPDMRILSGSALAPKKTTLTFVLKPGKSQVVAIQENTQIAWAQSCDEKAASGAFATTWGEANFVSTGSGYDVSAIMNPAGSNYDMTITSKEVVCVSSMTENFWLTDTQPIGDSNGSCYVPQSTMHLVAKMGGTV